jgi:galactitol-specific phosphotransferase system IIB component
MSEGCGSYHQLRENIEKALSELSVQADVSYHTVSYDEAIKLGLKGSPTIRINGRDLDEGGSPGIL